MSNVALSVSDSGFLDTGSSTYVSTFDTQKKLKFIELARQFWPNLSKCAEGVGISVQTVYNHLKRDVKFCEEIKAIKTAKLDELEQVAMDSGKDAKKGFLDRAMILRAHRPELYDRAKVVKIEGYKMNSGERAQRLGAVEAAVDATIVQAYSTRKERQQAKRLKAAERREESSSGGSGG
jgi:hypothetical protein